MRIKPMPYGMWRYIKRRKKMDREDDLINFREFRNNYRKQKHKIKIGRHYYKNLSDLDCRCIREQEAIQEMLDEINRTVIQIG